MAHKVAAGSAFCTEEALLHYSGNKVMNHRLHTATTLYLLITYEKHAINNAFKGINHKNPAPAKAKHSKPYATVKQRPGEPLATDRGAVDPVM